MKNRLYSVINIKSAEDTGDALRFKGVATTPGTDRVGDIVDPEGVEFELPIPLLWQHNHSQPVGTIKSAKVTAEGIEVEGEIPSIKAPSALAARLAEAAASLKAGLVRGLSIGFSPLEYSFMDSGGIHFTKWNWHELSLVTIPANAEANITSVKNFDLETAAALGITVGQEIELEELGSPVDTQALDASVKAGLSGVSDVQVSFNRNSEKPEGLNMKTLKEQLEKLAASRAEKRAQMEELLEKAGEAGTTLDAADQETFDTLQSEVEALDAHLKRLKSMDAINNQTLEVVTAPDALGSPVIEPVHSAPVGKSFNAIPLKGVAEKGIALAQICKFFARAKGNPDMALKMASADQRTDRRALACIKAAVAVGDTDTAAWAGNLVGDETDVFSDFAEWLRPQTLIGQFGQGSIPGLREVPFRSPLLSQSSGGTGYWVGEGAPIPVTSWGYGRTTLEPLKVGGIAVVTQELIRDSSPKADGLIRNELGQILIERLDTDFLDPDKAAGAASPASLTNGVTAIDSAGPTAANVRTDIKALVADFITNNQSVKRVALVMDVNLALALSLMQNPLGQSEFPDIGMDGGVLMGMPVAVTEYSPTDSNGSIVTAINADDIFYADGPVEIDLSMEAAVQMESAPDDPADATTVYTSLWQQGLVGFRAQKAVNWSKRRSTAVSYLYGVNWGDGQ